MDKKILRTLAVLTVGFGLNAVTPHNAAAEMTGTQLPVFHGLTRVQNCDQGQIYHRIHVPPYVAFRSAGAPVLARGGTIVGGLGRQDRREGSTDASDTRDRGAGDGIYPIFRKGGGLRGAKAIPGGLHDSLKA